MSSVEYDDKIVRMQFDNKQFESGVSTTLKSLESLKESLKFDNVVTGIDTMAGSIKNVSFTNISNGIEQTIVKIPVMGTVMDQTIRKMTDSVEGFVKSTLDKFSNIGNAMSGFSEYELQIGAVKTIKASTGEDVATINKYLEELNKYADDTIYSFSDMTQNIGKFTNAGVSLKDAVGAIKGIANEAAVSGANANEASRAMYNFAQALSAGSVKLIDWKSIENANMATVEFKNELIKTGLELGTIRKEGDKYVTLTTDAKGHISEAFDATSKFNEALSNQWMTSEVLVKTLNKYTDTTTEIGQKATEAATKVNTFHQALDAIVEDLGSNWTESWKYIVGDFEEATEMWTKFKDAVSGLFKPAAEARNEMLKFWSQNGIGAKENAENTEELAAKQKELFEIAHKGFMGDYGNGEARVKALTEAGYDYAQVQSIINGLVDGSVKSWEDVKIASDAAADSENKEMTGREMALKGISNIATSLKNIFGAVSEAWHDVFPRTTGKQLVEISKAFMEFTQAIKFGARDAMYLHHALRGLFALLDIGWQIVKGIAKGIKAVVSGILDALPKTDHQFGRTAAKIGDMIWEFDKMLKEGKYIEDFFVNIGSVIGKVLGGATKIIVKFISIIGGLVKALLSIAGPFPKVESIVDVFKYVYDSVSNFLTKIQEKIDSFSDIKMDGVKSFTDNLKSSFGGLTKITEAFSFIGEKLSYAWGGLKKVFQVIGAVIGPILDLIKDKIGSFTKSMTFDDFIKYLKEGGTIAILYELLSLIKRLKKGLKKNSIADSITEMFGSIGSAFEEMKKRVQVSKLTQIAVSILLLVAAVIVLANMPKDKLAAGLAALTAIFAELMALMLKTDFASIKSATSELLALGLAITLMVKAVKTLSKLKPEDAAAGITMLGFILAELVITIRKFGKDTADLSGVAGTLIALGVAIDLLILPIIALGLLPEKMIRRGLEMLGIIFLELIGTIKLLESKVPKLQSSLKGVTPTLLSLAITINLLILPILILGTLALVAMPIVLAGLAVIEIIFIMLASTVRILAKAKIKNGTIAAIWSLISMISLMSLLVLTMGAIPKEIAKQGLLVMGAIMLGLIVFSASMNAATKKMKPNKMKKILIELIGAIAIMAGLVYLLGNMDSKDRTGGLLALVAIMAAIVVSMIALGAVFSNPKMMAGIGAVSSAFLAFGASVALLGAGIALLINALIALNNVEFGPQLLQNMAIVGAAMILFIENAIGGFIGAILMAAPAVINGILSIISLVLEALDDNLDSILTHITNIIERILVGIEDNIYNIVNHVLGIITKIFEAIDDNTDNIKNWAATITSVLAAIIDGVAVKMDDLLTAIDNLFYAIFDHWSDPTWQVTMAQKMAEGIKGLITMAMGVLYELILEPLGNLGLKIVAGIVGGIVEGANKAMEVVVDFMEDAANVIVNGANKMIPFSDPFDPVKLPSPPKIPMPGWVEDIRALASGAKSVKGTAIVGEAGPELLSNYGGRTQVTPLDNTSTKSVIGDYFYKVNSSLNDISKTLQNGNSNTKDNSYDDSDVRSDISKLNDSISEMKDYIGRIQLVMDGKAVVGRLIDPIDEALGKKAIRIGRRG